MLKDRIVVITGSSRGLGHAMAIEFQRAGARVVLSSRNAEAVDSALRKLPNPENAIGLKCDVRSLDEVRALADGVESRFGKIDIWINNAGLAHPFARLDAIEPTRWRESFDTIFFGSYHGSLTALENMLPRHSGQIINILGMGADRPSPNQSAYGSAKAAVLQLTRTLAKEYAGSGISINSVMPGMIWTEMLTKAEGVDDPRLRKRMEWAMRVFGNPASVPARYIVDLAQHPNGSGKLYRLLTPRVFVPRMIREILGVSKHNPRPWE